MNVGLWTIPVLLKRFGRRKLLLMCQLQHEQTNGYYYIWSQASASSCLSHLIQTLQPGSGPAGSANGRNYFRGHFRQRKVWSINTGHVLGMYCISFDSLKPWMGFRWESETLMFSESKHWNVDWGLHLRYSLNGSPSIKARECVVPTTHSYYPWCPERMLRMPASVVWSSYREFIVGYYVLWTQKYVLFLLPSIITLRSISSQI